MLIAIGHDIQRIADMDSASALRTPGVFFTENECAHVARSKAPQVTLAGLFSAKEALFKALPDDLSSGFYWSDVEIGHRRSGKPEFALHGNLARVFTERGWRAELSISHSGDYASAVTLLVQGPPQPGPAAALAPTEGEPS